VDAEGAEVDLARAPFRPAVFLYDNYPGGMGMSAPLFDQRHVVVAQARELVERCGCRNGCPACVGPILASDARRARSPKTLALEVLALLALPAPSPSS
jgi:DEAD/DEAH box helicase domain-containing protein